MENITLRDGKRLVIKIGSALLVDEESGQVRREWLLALAEDVANLRKRGQEVVIVTSGAGAVGREHLGLTGRKLKLEEKQAATAVGQLKLMHAYQEVFAQHDITVAQILLTMYDTEDRRRHLNGRATFEQLLRLGVVPVVNENDTVATSEIKFGDNDRLAARVAQMISADMLVLLSDIDGLYTDDPRKNPEAEHIPVIRELTPAIEAMAKDPLPGDSSGGMVTKIGAARVAMSAGCRMAIAKGKPPHALAGLEKSHKDGGALCSWFLTASEPLTARKRWIAGHVKPAGCVVIDKGAATALSAGKSLLPAGVRAVEGEFSRGDLVQVKSQEGAELGRGLIAYGSIEARTIAGHSSQEIENLLGYQGRDEMIHRDNFVMVV